MSDASLVRADQRGRVSLGGIVRAEEQYKVTADERGRIILEPAVVLTETELRLLQDEKYWERIRTSLNEPRSPFELDDL